MVSEQMARLTSFVSADEPPPPAGTVLVARAGLSIAEGRYAEAEAYLEAALSIDPYDNRALSQLAVIYRLTGRDQKARSFEQMMRDVDMADTGSWVASEPELPILDDAVNIQRFVIFEQLLESGLITPNEYDARREANLGALLPLTQPAPALTGGRRLPLSSDVIERLRTIARFNQIGALNDDAYGVERNAILQGLMPLPISLRREIAAVVPEALDPEAHQEKIDRLLASKLISTREYNKESAVLVGLYTPAAGAMEDTDSAPAGRLSMNDTPLIVMDEDAMAREQRTAALDAAVPESPPDEGADTAEMQLSSLGDEAATGLDETPPLAPLVESVTRIDVHLALSRTPESARRSWEDLQQANGLALDGLIPRVSRVDLGGGKGVFFQLSAGPLVDMAAAEALCDELLSRDFYCAPLVF